MQLSMPHLLVGRNFRRRQAISWRQFTSHQTLMLWLPIYREWIMKLWLTINLIRCWIQSWQLIKQIRIFQTGKMANAGKMKRQQISSMLKITVEVNSHMTSWLCSSNSLVLVNKILRVCHPRWLSSSPNYNCNTSTSSSKHYKISITARKLARCHN